MVAHAGGRTTLTKAEAAIVRAVRDSETGRAEPGKRTETYTRSIHGSVHVVTVVGPERLVRGLVRAGILRAGLDGLVELADG